MIAIRLSKKDHARAWRAMIEVAPVRRVGKEIIYEVFPAHLELLGNLGIRYEVVHPPSAQERLRRATAD